MDRSLSWRELRFLYGVFALVSLALGLAGAGAFFYLLFFVCLLLCLITPLAFKVLLAIMKGQGGNK